MPALRILPIAPYRHKQVVDLFSRVIADDPTYAPAVSRGDLTVQEWVTGAQPEWVRVACWNGNVIGHVAVRNNRTPPQGATLPNAAVWELCRLAVAPAYREQDIAHRLVNAAEHVFGHRLWGTSHTGSISHGFLSRRGWTPAGETFLPEDPTPVTIMVNTRPR
jgi:GNAT superfamily N-acetyltransferase